MSFILCGRSGVEYSTACRSTSGCYTSDNIGSFGCISTWGCCVCYSSWGRCFWRVYCWSLWLLSDGLCFFLSTDSAAIVSIGTQILVILLTMYCRRFTSTTRVIVTYGLATNKVLNNFYTLKRLISLGLMTLLKYFQYIVLNYKTTYPHKDGIDLIIRQYYICSLTDNPCLERTNY